jgi:quercetin dioxygenase-like cupin family protein
VKRAQAARSGGPTVYVGDDRLTLPAGSFAFGPHGVPHTFIAETEGAKVLIGFQPFLFRGVHARGR